MPAQRQQNDAGAAGCGHRTDPCLFRVRALPDGERGEHYMFVSPDHLSSIRGVEKAGFRVIGHVERRRFGIWKKVKETEAGHT